MQSSYTYLQFLFRSILDFLFHASPTTEIPFESIFLISFLVWPAYSTSFKTGSGLHIQARERSTAPSLDSVAGEGNLNLEQGEAMVGRGSQACATLFSPLPDPSTTKEHQWPVPEPPTRSRGEDIVFLKRRGEGRATNNKRSRATYMVGSDSPFLDHITYPRHLLSPDQSVYSGSALVITQQECPSKDKAISITGSKRFLKTRGRILLDTHRFLDCSKSHLFQPRLIIIALVRMASQQAVARSIFIAFIE